MIKDLIKDSDMTLKEKAAAKKQIYDLTVKCDALRKNLSFLKLEIEQAIKNRRKAMRKAMADYTLKKIKGGQWND